MSQAIAVLNAGSSSLKFSLHEVVEGNLRVAVRGQIEGLGTTPHFKAKDAAGKNIVDADLPKRGSTVGHDESFEYLVEWLRGHFADRMQPIGVGHRVVHGGAEFIKPTLVDAQVLKKLEALIPLVPLHQPHNLAGIKAVTKTRPDLPQVACFDTAFHQGRASVTERFALPDELFQRGIRRWGFHGLSYEYVIGSFKKIAPDVAGGARDCCASRVRREFVRHAQRQMCRYDHELFRPGRASDGHALRQPRSRRHSPSA